MSNSEIKEMSAYHFIKLVADARNNGLVAEDTIFTCISRQNGKKAWCCIPVGCDYMELFYDNEDIDCEPHRFSEKEFNDQFIVLGIKKGR